MNVVLDKRITIEQKVVSGQDAYGADTYAWAVVATVWAELQDALPSRSESVKQGLAQARNQTRVRIRYRSDVDSSMRIVMRRPGAVTYQIVGGPAEIDGRKYLEFVVEKYSS